MPVWKWTREEEKGRRERRERSRQKVRRKDERKGREKEPGRGSTDKRESEGRTVGPSLALFSGCGLLVPRLHPRHWQRRTPAVI